MRVGSSISSATLRPVPGSGIANAEPHHVEHDPPRQAEAVRVKPGRRQAEYLVPDAHRGAVDDPRALDDTDGEARQVVLARRVAVAVLGHLAADQGAAGLPAALGDSTHHGFDLGRVEPPDAM
jgi:hypothetical protein